MNTEISEAIFELESNIADENRRIELLKRYEQLVETGLSEKDYHALCETNMRNSDCLGKALIKVFPYLIYERKEANCFVFRTFEEGYTVCVPSSRVNCITIVTDKYYFDEKTTEKSVDGQYLMNRVEREKEIARKEAFLSSRSVIKRASIAFPHSSRTVSFFAYIFSCIGKNGKAIEKFPTSWRACTKSRRKRMTERTSYCNKKDLTAKRSKRYSHAIFLFS